MINLISTDGDVRYGIYEYVVDSEEELNLLPRHIAMGSAALVLATGNVHIKSGDNEWIAIGGNSSGGGSVDPALVKQIKENTAQIALLNETIVEQSAIIADLEAQLTNTISTEEIEALGDEDNA